MEDIDSLGSVVWAQKEGCIMFNGEIVFDIADEEQVEVDLGAEIMPTKIVKKGDVVVLGRKASKNRWMYKISYSNEKEYLESLENNPELMLNSSCWKGLKK